MKKLSLIALLSLLLAVPASAQLRKYGQSTTLYFSLVELAGVNFATAASCVTGDVKIIKDGGAAANTTSCFVSEGEGIYSLALTGTEMQCAECVVTVKDQTNPKVWLDDALVVSSYGSTSAQHAMDLDSSNFLESQRTIFRGTINTDDAAASLTQFEADLVDGSGAPTDLTSLSVPDGANRINNAVIVFTSGALTGTRRTVADYVAAHGRGFFTVTQLSETPAEGDTFVIF